MINLRIPAPSTAGRRQPVFSARISVPALLTTAVNTPPIPSLHPMRSSFGLSVLIICLFGLALPAPIRAQADDLEIRGDAVSKEKTEVMLVQKSTGTGRWVAVGQTFAGYKVTAYDAKTGQLTLTKDNQTRILTLTKATVQAAQASPVTPEQQKALMNNLRQLSAAADQYFLEQGVSRVEIAKLVGTTPEKYIKEIKPVAGETYTGLVIEQGKPIRIKTAGGFEMEYKN